MGWIAIAFICVLVILIVVFKTSQRKDGEKGRRKPTVATYPIRIPSRNKEIHRLLELAYATKQRMTIQYETGNPLPREPAIKTRDIDIYGIGDEYLEAYCHYRGQIRIFKISRLIGVRLSGETYGIPRAYTPSTWVTEGWGDLGDTRLESMEVVHTKDPRSYIPEDTEDKDERTKRERVSKKAASYGRGEGTKTYVQYGWDKRWKEAIRTLFPDEWSPALPYLYEANRLEREGANQESIQEVLDQARKAEELARQAEKLDGTGYKRLVILAWDYDYNYSSELENRLKAAKQPMKTKIESRTIPPDIYDYLKKAKDEDEIEPLRGKIQFYEKPYLRLTRPQVKQATEGKAEVTIGIERYVVFDLPVAQKEREKLQAAIKDNFAILIDYWAVDWDYDGYTFKSQWQDMRGNGRKTKVVTTQASTNLVTGKAYTIAVRLVDIFGNDAAGTVEVKL